MVIDAIYCGVERSYGLDLFLLLKVPIVRGLDHEVLYSVTRKCEYVHSKLVDAQRTSKRRNRTRLSQIL